jgi:hypothetical protein
MPPWDSLRARDQWRPISLGRQSDRPLSRGPGWELHIAGCGELTAQLEKIAAHDNSIVFHGLPNREENARFIGMAKVGINPHDKSQTSSNVFAFKIIDYLAAGHCITTPKGHWGMSQ